MNFAAFPTIFKIGVSFILFNFTSLFSSRLNLLFFEIRSKIVFTINAIINVIASAFCEFLNVRCFEIMRDFECVRFRDRKIID